MAPRTPVRQSQALPVNGAQGGAGGARGAAAGGAAAAAAAAARDQNPPWRSSLDLVWSYSRSQAFYGDNIGTSPSFADRRWAGPHRASIAEESDPNLSSHTDQEDDEDGDAEDMYTEYEDEDEYDDREDYEEGYVYEDEDDGEIEPHAQTYSRDAHDDAADEARDAVPSTSLAGLPQPPPAKQRRLSPRGINQQQREYFSSDDEQDHLGRRRSKIPSSRSQVRAVLAAQQQNSQHQQNLSALADSSAVETSSAVSGTDMSTASDATGGAGDGDEWDGEQLPPNAIQRSAATPLPRARRRRRSRNPPSAYRGPRRSSSAYNTDGENTSAVVGPSGRPLVRRKRSSDRISIDSDFSTARPSRSQQRNHHQQSQTNAQGRKATSGPHSLYGAVEPLRPQRDVEGADSRTEEGAPLLGTGTKWRSNQLEGGSDLRKLSRISSTGFSTAVKTPRFMESQGTSTFLQSWFNTLNALIGVGVLALPLAFALTGPILGPILFLLAGLLTNYTGKVLARIMARNPQLRTYADVGTFAFGPSARWVVTALFCLELWAVCTALIILFGDSVYAVAQWGNPALWKIVGFAIILPTVFLPLKFLSPISVIGIVSTITLFFVVLADGLIKKEAPGSLWEPRVDSLLPQWSRLPLSFGLIMSGFSSHPVIPSLFKDMQQPHRFPQMLDRAYIVATIIYLGMGLAGYLMFGNDVTDEITRDLSKIHEYPRVLNSVAIWLIIINPLAKFALAARPITTTAELIFGVEKSQEQIQEALARQLQLQREDEEAFMAGAGHGPSDRSVPPRKSSEALSAGRRADSARRRSADIPAIPEEGRRTSDPQAVPSTGDGASLTPAQPDDDDEAQCGLNTPTQAALFASGNPFAGGDQREGGGRRDEAVAAADGKTVAKKVLPDPVVAEPASAALSPPLAPSGGRRRLSDNRGQRESFSTTGPAASAPDGQLMERALQEVGMNASDLNPLAASAFSMRMAELAARQSPGFRISARVGVKIGVTVLLTLTAILVPGFEKVMAFLGAFLAFASCVFGPLLAHLRIFHASMSNWRIGLDIAILAVSFVAAALGTVWSFLPR